MSNPNQKKQDTLPPSTALTPPACSPALSEIALQAMAELGEAHKRTCDLIQHVPLICRRTRQRLVDEVCALTCAMSDHLDDIVVALSKENLEVSDRP